MSTEHDNELRWLLENISDQPDRDPRSIARDADRLFTPRWANGHIDRALNVARSVAPALGVNARDIDRTMTAGAVQAMTRAVTAQSWVEAVGARMRISPLWMALGNPLNPIDGVQWMNSRVGHWRPRNHHRHEPTGAVARAVYAWREAILADPGPPLVEILPGEVGPIADHLRGLGIMRTPVASLSLANESFARVDVAISADVTTPEGRVRVTANCAVGSVESSTGSPIDVDDDEILALVSRVVSPDDVFIARPNGARPTPEVKPAVSLDGLFHHRGCKHSDARWVGQGDWWQLLCPDCANPAVARFLRHALPSGHAGVEYLEVDTQAKAKYVARRQAEMILRGLMTSTPVSWDDLLATAPSVSLDPRDWSRVTALSAVRRPRNVRAALAPLG